MEEAEFDEDNGEDKLDDISDDSFKDVAQDIKKNKGKISDWLFFAMCICLALLAWYSIQLQNDYNILVQELNTCRDLASGNLEMLMR